MLPGMAFVGFSSSSAQLVATYRDSTSDDVDRGNYTFLNMGVGPASSDRYIVVVANGKDSGANSITSITVGGDATTILAERTATTQPACIAVTNDPVTSGTSKTIVVNLSGIAARMSIAVYSVTGLPSLTAFDTLSTAATDPSGAIDVAANGVIIATAGNSVSTATVTWTNITEDADFNVESADTVSFASIGSASAQTITITANFSSSSGDFLLAASLRPT